MNSCFFNGFIDELVKLSTLKDIVALAKKEPLSLREVISAATKGKGGDIGKGILYGTAGYGALSNLGYRDPDSRKREPLHGAAKGAAKALLLAGLPAAAIYRYPAMSRAAAKLVAKTPG